MFTEQGTVDNLYLNGSVGRGSMSVLILSLPRQKNSYQKGDKNITFIAYFRTWNCTKNPFVFILNICC
jgi:hypothetical protein